MLALVAVIIVYLLSIAGCIAAGTMFEIDNEPLSILAVIILITSIVLMCIAWIPLLGLKVLKP